MKPKIIKKIEKTYGISLSEIKHDVSIEHLPYRNFYSRDFEGKVRGLNLMHNNITFLAEEIFELDELRLLQLKSNRISGDLEIHNLKNLEYLNLSNNKVHKIKCLDSSNLIVLNLDNNGLSEIDGLSKLTNLVNLGLCSNNISEISELHNLKNLVYLRLSKNKIKFISGLDTLENLDSLFLDNNEVTEIRGLDRLLKLTKLYLSENKISSISNLSNNLMLHTLDLSFNSIKKIEGISQLDQLRVLLLNNNNINYINEIAKIENLESLFISNNKISKIENLPESLLYIDLSDNLIKEIENLEKLKSLVNISLSFNKISKIQNLDQLDSLRTLDLSYNNINKIEGFDSLKYLTSVNLSGNYISRIENLDTLTHLVELSLHQNNIRQIEGLDNLENLRSLFLGLNSINTLSGVEKLKNLERLILSKSTLVSLAGLDFLTNISDLRINSNNISEIGELQHLLKLSKISYLEINNNPFIKSTDLILYPNHNHKDAVISYLKRYIELDKDEVIYPVKVAFWGNHGSGKSTFLKYISNSDKRKLDFIKVKSTHILEVKSLKKQKSFLPDAIIFDFGGQDYYHGVYQAFYTHNAINLLFWKSDSDNNDVDNDKSNNNLFVRNFNRLYWLHQLSYFSEPQIYPNQTGVKTPSLVFIIQTHADISPKADYFSDVVDNVSVEGQFFVSLSGSALKVPKFKYSLQYLESIIIEKIANRRIVRQEPTWYLKFIKYLLEYNSSKPLEVSNLYSLFFKEIKNFEIEDLKGTLDMLSNQGLVLYFHQTKPIKNPYNEEDFDLSNYVWPNISKTVELVYQVLNKKFILESNGKILKDDFIRHFDCQELVIMLLEKKVVFFDKYDIQPKFIIPGYLPLFESTSDNLLMSIGFNSPTFIMKFTQFIPFGLINQFVCHFGNIPDVKSFWRDRLVFSINDVKVMIKLDISLLEIQVYIVSPNSKNIKSLERLIFGEIIFLLVPSSRWIFKDYFSVFNSSFLNQSTSVSSIYQDIDSIGGSIPPESTSDSDNKEPFHKPNITYDDFIDYLHFIKGSGQTNEFITSGKFLPKDLFVSFDNNLYVNYSILENEIITDIDINAYSKTDQGILNLNFSKGMKAKDFQNISSNRNIFKTKNVFISYSNHDYHYLNKLQTFLKPFTHLNIIETWDCTMLRAGNWHQQIQKKLHESDIVIFMLSPDFLASNYILEHELLPSFKEIKYNKNKKFFFVYLRPVPLDSLASYSDLVDLDEFKGKMDVLQSIANYQFVPYKIESNGRKLHPVSKWEKDEDSAFVEIVEQLLSNLD